MWLSLTMMVDTIELVFGAGMRNFEWTDGGWLFHSIGGSASLTPWSALYFFWHMTGSEKLGTKTDTWFIFVSNYYISFKNHLLSGKDIWNYYVEIICIIFVGIWIPTRVRALTWRIPVIWVSNHVHIATETIIIYPSVYWYLSIVDK